MKNEPEIKPPRKHPEKTGLTLLFLVGGFILLIMILGWLWISSRG